MSLGSIGKAIKKATKSVSKAVTKQASNLVRSSAKVIETAVSGTAKLATGDISGALDKYGRTITNAANVVSMGSVDLTGRKKGIINVDTPRYANAMLGRYSLKSSLKSSLESGGLVGSASEGRISLRAGKKAGGGSMFAKAKYPLGGQTGVAGK